jgi:hypothetical protein
VYYCEDYNSELSIKALRESGIEMTQMNINLLDVTSSQSDLLRTSLVPALILIHGMLNLKLPLRPRRLSEDVWREASDGNQSRNHPA